MIHTDRNQPEIVRVLRAAGCSVEVLSPVARGGLPDLLVGRSNGVNYLLEVKAPGGRLNAAQKAWHLAWRAPVHVVRSPEEALRAVGLSQPSSR